MRPASINIAVQSGAAAGSATVQVAMLDPSTDLPAIRFAYRGKIRICGTASARSKWNSDKKRALIRPPIASLRDRFGHLLPAYPSLHSGQVLGGLGMRVNRAQEIHLVLPISGV